MIIETKARYDLHRLHHWYQCSSHCSRNPSPSR